MLHPSTKTIHSELIATLSHRFPLISPLKNQEPNLCSGTPEGFFYRFIKENLTQREERTADAPRLLGALLARPNAKEIASQLDPNYRPHRRLVCEDILSEVRQEVTLALEQRHGSPLARQVKLALDKQLDRYYRGVMGPYIIALQELKKAPNAKKGTSLPNGFLSGRQGIANSMTLLDYIVNDSPGLSLKQQLQAIGEGAFSVEFFTEHHFAGALTSQFQNSPAVALRRYYLEHPSHRVRRHTAHLGEEHFPQTNGLWTEQGSSDLSPGDGWEFEAHGSRWVNKGLARSAIGQVIDSMISNPTGRPLPASDYTARVENLIESVTETDFNAYRVRFNRAFGTVVPLVYGGSLPNAIIDYLRHLPRVDIREHFDRLRPYHFRRINTWTDPSGNPKLELAREAIGEAFTTLERKLGPERFDIQRIPELFESQWLSESHFFCHFNPAAVIAGAYGFPYVAGIIDFLTHHPSASVRELYKDLQPRHFARVTNGLWSVKDFGDGPAPEGWRYEDSSQRFVNVGEARNMTAELLDRITGDESADQISVVEIPSKVTLKHFTETALRYNARARGMLAAVYSDSPRLALLDFIMSAEFAEYVRKRPRAAETLTDAVGIAQFRHTAEQLLSIPQRGRLSLNR